jgi:hypothetical protein
MAAYSCGGYLLYLSVSPVLINIYEKAFYNPFVTIRDLCLRPVKTQQGVEKAAGQRYG